MVENKTEESKDTDITNLKKLLEVYIEKLQIPPEYAVQLKAGLNDPSVDFKDVILDVAEEMGRDKRREVQDIANELEDITPFFTAHEFW